MRGRIVAMLVLLAAATSAWAGDVGFAEDFALSKERAAALKQLIPGTEDYYYYSCLNFQNTDQLDQVDPLLKLWAQRYGRTARVKEIENRQALLRYEKDNKATLEYLKRELGLTFSQQRQILGAPPPALPGELDPNTISRETLATRALSNDPKTLNGFEPSALDWLIATDLTGEQRRELLRRLTRPDYENLPKLVADDLNFANGAPFGSMPIHGQMLLAQLDELLKLQPSLLNEVAFVDAYIAKLQPNPDVDWVHDIKARTEYYDRLWAFVSTLGSAHNSLKANVLYNRLVLDRAAGAYNEDRFMAYIKLPRNVSYINPKYVQQQQRDNRVSPVNLSASFTNVALLPPIVNDEPLVRSYLAEFFLKKDTFEPYQEFILDTYLREVFAETKIVNGIGDQEKWYSLLSPAQYQALKDRVDIDFAFTNKSQFAVGDEITLDVTIKNVPNLIVNVYRINEANYYRANPYQINTNINLDGLVANEVTTKTYQQAPLLRHKETFRFPAMKDRGTFVVDFIGGGKASRALIRKGNLQFVTRVGSAGQVFTILDEAGKKVPTASLYVAGHQFIADADGTITVPFSTEQATGPVPMPSPQPRGGKSIMPPPTPGPATEPVIIMLGDFASLSSFQRLPEQYAMNAGIHVERESLLKGNKAKVVIRPELSIHGAPVAISLLQTPVLVITSTDRDGISTGKEVPNIALVDGKDFTYEFQVPDNTVAFQFMLKGKVRNLSMARDDELAVNRSFELNKIDTTDKIEDLHLLHVAGKYAIDLLGKTGEPKAQRAIQLEIKQHDFTQPVHAILATDAAGRVNLGTLDGIDRVHAMGPGGTGETWLMARDMHSMPGTIQGKVGSAVNVPYMGDQKDPVRSELSLLEVRGGVFVKDLFAAIKLQDGFVRIEGLPAGDYSLLLKETGQAIDIRIGEGGMEAGHVISPNRQLQVLDAAPLQIAGMSADKDNIRIQLANAGKTARVHVFATRYISEYPQFADLALPVRNPGMAWPEKLTSLYLAGRDLGDEYRYILDRKYAQKFPGNMLDRPSLLLAPWAISKSETLEKSAKGGEMYAATAMPSPRPPMSLALASSSELAAMLGGGFADLDYLSQPAAVMLNLTADDKGVVTIARKDLGAHQQIHVLAVDSQGEAYRELSLDEIKMDTLDLRLSQAGGLDPKGHFTEQKLIDVLNKGQSITLVDKNTSVAEAYDSVAKVYALYATLSKNPTLAEFSFVADWAKLKPEEKQAKYSKYACHELNFFLSKKDPEFFAAIVKPFIANKKDKTFMDLYLLGEDVSAFMKPWAHDQLNAVERILLAQRIKDEQARTARDIKDQFDLLPPDIERFNFLFKTALKSSGLEVAPGLVPAAAAAQAWANELDREVGRSPATPPVVSANGAKLRSEAAGRGGGTDGAMKKMSEAVGKAEQVKADLEDKLTEDREEMRDKAKDLDARRSNLAQQFYRKLEKTEEWVENNYYHLPIEQAGAGLIKVNAFWKDYAAFDGNGEFLSTNLAEASHNFAEMMLAIAVLDMPFAADKPVTAEDGMKITVTAGGPTVLYHKEIKPAKEAADKTPILVSQNFFRANDRYQFVDNEKIDKYVTDEFLINVVYGCQVVVTNPTSSRQKLDVLLQVPVGAMPVSNGLYTRGVHVAMEPFSTQSVEYYFYFPAAGQFQHYPVQVARNETLLAFCQPMVMNVVETPSKVDRTSWDYISQNGTKDEVMQFLKDNNLYRIDLARIAWRMREAEFFTSVINLLSERHVYNDTLWSFGIHNNVPAVINQYLRHCDSFVSACGPYLVSPLLTIDPVERKSYQHMEYLPLVNARAHKLGKQWTILNDRFSAQYQRLMNVLAHKKALDDDDLMAVTYYMLLQDRVEEGLAFFARVDAKKLATQLQYDYFMAYVAFYNGKPDAALEIAKKYQAYPAERWRNFYANVTTQVAQINGKATTGPANPDNRTESLTAMAASQGNIDFKVEARQVALTYQNLKSIRVSYYPMDIELLFSRNPFVQQYSDQFSFIQPNLTQTMELDPKKTTITFELPKQFHNSNVMIEIDAGSGQKKSQAYFSNSLAVQLVENYGQIQVANDKTGGAVPKAYVKVYARYADGKVRFYKDGYTDLRGRFDYSSLSTESNPGQPVEKFSILIMSDKDGAVVREANPPKQ